MALHSRIRRVNEEIKTALAWILQNEIKDPRVTGPMVTITHVETSKDLQHARVWVSVLGNDEETVAAIRALNHSKGFIKHLLAERIVLRFLPDLEFLLDEAGRHAARINELLKQIERTESPKDSENLAESE